MHSHVYAKQYNSFFSPCIYVERIQLKPIKQRQLEKKGNLLLLLLLLLLLKKEKEERTMSTMRTAVEINRK